jgi:hypothetical protein
MEDYKNTESSEVDSLRNQLESFGIDTTTWGTGEAKTIEHLYKEIKNGETILVVNDAGELLRKVIVGGTDVYYTSPEGKRYHLKEEKQVFKDGRERRRNLETSVGGKIKPNEDPKDATMREIKEELGIVSEIDLKEMGGQNKRSKLHQVILV